jgi:predicted RNA-binding Zn ribbon-like protein
MHIDVMHSRFNGRAMAARGTARSIQQPSSLRMRPATHCISRQSLFEDILIREAIRTLIRERTAGTSVETENRSLRP